MNNNPKINEEFLGRWANNSLSVEELTFFKNHKEYALYQKIFDISALFKAPEFDKEQTYIAIKQQVSNQKPKTTTSNLRIWIGAVAASLVLLLGLFYTLSPNKKIIKTMVAETTLFNLPDGSVVQLNANSTLEYDTKKFLRNRNVILKGEAYFKVAEGSKFTVKTNKAEVSVLGTEFNVIDRKGIFETNCYEGKVAVTTKNHDEILTANKGIRFLNDKIISVGSDQSQPQWISKVSSFKKVPLSVVINELQNQYPITIDASKIDQNQLISTRFTHVNLQEALQTVFEPMNIKFTFTSKSQVVLK